jgi:hypothetical protein
MASLIFCNKALQSSDGNWTLEFGAALEFAKLTHRANQGACSCKDIGLSDSLDSSSKILLCNLADEFGDIIGGGAPLTARSIIAPQTTGGFLHRLLRGHELGEI